MNLQTLISIRNICAIALCLWESSAKTVTYDFNVTWVTANPDGLAERKVIGINGHWPLPIIEVDKNDRLVVNMYNGLGDKDTSVHFHGMYQNGTNSMDGLSMVTQCPVPPGSSITYNFTVPQNGTYWYHCHTDYCYPDGYRQALIVNDANAYFYDQYDEQFTITLSDWYHEMMTEIAPDFISPYNPAGAEPIPNAFLFNDTMNTSIPVQPGKTYLVRLINTSAFVAQYFYIEDHTFDIVEIDGIYTEPTQASTLYIHVAQRYSILLRTKNATDQNYNIVTVADQVLLDVVPSHLVLNHTNWLEYNSSAPKTQANVTLDIVSGLPAFDDFTLVPYDKQPLLPDPDYTINLQVAMRELANGLPYAFFNNITYTRPDVPTLYTVLSSGDLATNAAIYSQYTNPFILPKNAVVDVIVNNADTGSHPFHLHGHNFQVLARFPSYGPSFYAYKSPTSSGVSYDPNNHPAFPSFPARRDTLVMPPRGYFVIRFIADNPGVWMFHCHIDWHLEQGLAATFIEAPLELQAQLSIPADHLAACEARGIKTTGNAAGNVEDFLDLRGENKQAGFIPYGKFTAKGYVAMGVSVSSACAGILCLAVYGMSDGKGGKKSGGGGAGALVTSREKLT
ncbi:putative ferrooxidoreductase Fet3 [Mollisia scopiformis]|uniref:Putative ferrooxidoreductase Fet3 n=1 Tax=Mollisia scopiformis TaxID=149040 RepID=A0A194WXD5_MOLSC|nr:putative ferrooxidoreductase Fet3 [Mollisia scopiformis]KUJ12595.1 putative ferrooxidoreductase Fet3 [Mollisia scopiformis]